VKINIIGSARVRKQIASALRKGMERALADAADDIRSAVQTNWPEVLRTFRKKHGLTQKQLAARLPSGLRTVEDWERRKRVPPEILKRALRDLARELANLRVKAN
jgi:DNA-binding transcriptional regulator YiaG